MLHPPRKSLKKRQEEFEIPDMVYDLYSNLIKIQKYMNQHKINVFLHVYT